MKSAITASMLAILTLTAPAALSADSPATKPMAGKPMGMMDEKHMAHMQDNMKIMQDQMKKVRATKDPKERQKLMQEHMQTMQKNMEMMRGMGGPMMATMGGQDGGQMSGMDPKQRQEMMEKRMDMMQMMMEQMMQHDQMMQPAPAK